jgi:hypothetical protein
MQRLANNKANTLRKNSMVWRWFREENSLAPELRWFVKDNFFGMQQWRGVGGRPLQVAPVGENEFVAKAGTYGEFRGIHERELMGYVDPANPGNVIDLSKTVVETQDQLLDREYTLKNFILWKLMVDGTFSVATQNGSVAYSGQYTQASFTASVAWATYATATPLKDVLGLPVTARGKRVNFGRGATILLNQTTANHMVLNRNPDDLGGRFLGGGNKINTLSDVNRILDENGCPTIEVCEEGYHNDSNTWTLFIPDNKFVLVGTRPDTNYVGRYVNTANPNAASGMGAYSKFVLEEDEVPVRAEVHQGHNGGPTMEHPGMVVKGNV